MTKQEKGDYKFNTDYQLAVNEDGLPTGHYRQNVDHYVFMQGEDETEDGSESVDTGSTGNTGSTGSTADGSNTETEMAIKLRHPEKRLLQCCIYCSRIAGWHDKYQVSGRD